MAGSYTISNQNGPVSSRGHNLRDPKVIKNQLHIDPEGVHETWIDEKPEDAYKRIFGDAVKEYNKTVKRKDRRIRDYYKEIRNSKKKHPVYEVIITVGNSDNRVDNETGKAIMREYVDDWKYRNPNLDIIGAYYHSDEYDPETGRYGAAHVHIDYIPVAYDCEKGPSVQNALSKALEQQGFSGEGPQKSGIIKWQRSERADLEWICHKHGISVVETKRDQRHRLERHLDTDIYKKKKKLEEVEMEIESAMEKLESYNARLLNEEEIRSIKATQDGYVAEIPLDDFLSLRYTAIEDANESEKRAKLEEEKKMLEEKLAEAIREKEAMTTSYRLLGASFQTYKKHVKSRDAMLDHEATQMAADVIRSNDIPQR